MKFYLERVSEPDIEPVTLAELKVHLRAYADQVSEDSELDSLITAAREWAEDYTGRALIDQSWRLTVTDYVSGDIHLHKSPALSVTSVVSVGTDSAETVIDPGSYELRGIDGKWPVLFPVVALTSGILKIEFRAGYADRLGSPQEDALAVPVRFKQAIKLWAEAHYDRDPKSMELLLDVAEKVLRPERVDMQVAS